MQFRHFSPFLVAHLHPCTAAFFWVMSSLEFEGLYGCLVNFGPSPSPSVHAGKSSLTGLCGCSWPTTAACFPMGRRYAVLLNISPNGGGNSGLGRY